MDMLAQNYLFVGSCLYPIPVVPDTVPVVPDTQEVIIPALPSAPEIPAAAKKPDLI